MFPACRTLALCLLPLAAGPAPLQDQAYHPSAGCYAGVGLSDVNLRIPGRDVEGHHPLSQLSLISAFIPVPAGPATLWVGAPANRMRRPILASALLNRR